MQSNTYAIPGYCDNSTEWKHLHMPVFIVYSSCVKTKQTDIYLLYIILKENWYREMKKHDEDGKGILYIIMKYWIFDSFISIKLCVSE